MTDSSAALRRPLAGLVQGPVRYTPGGTSIFVGNRVVPLKNGRPTIELPEGRISRVRGLPKLGEVTYIIFSTASFPYEYKDKVRLPDNTEVPVRLNVRIQLTPGSDLVQLVRREGLNILGKLLPELDGELRRLLRNSLNLRYQDAEHDELVTHASPKELLVGARPFFGDAYIIESVADLEVGVDEWRRKQYVIERADEVAGTQHKANINNIGRANVLEVRRIFGLQQQANLLGVTAVEVELLKKVPAEILKILPIQLEARAAIAGKVLDNLRALADMTDATSADVSRIVERSIAAVEGLSVGSTFSRPVVTPAPLAAPDPATGLGHVTGLLQSLAQSGGSGRVRFVVEADSSGARVQLEVVQGDPTIAMDLLGQQLRQMLGVDRIDIDLTPGLDHDKVQP